MVRELKLMYEHLLALSNGEHIINPRADIVDNVINGNTQVFKQLMQEVLPTWKHYTGNPAAPYVCTDGWNCLVRRELCRLLANKLMEKYNVRNSVSS